MVKCRCLCGACQGSLYERCRCASVVWVTPQEGCSFIFGLVAASLRAQMKYADSHLICRASSKLKLSFRLSKSRSNLSCHYNQSPTQTRHAPVIRYSAMSCVKWAQRFHSRLDTAGHVQAQPRSDGPFCWPTQLRHCARAVFSTR